MKKILITIRSKIARAMYTLLCKLAKEQIEDARIDAYEDGFNAGMNAIRGTEEMEEKINKIIEEIGNTPTGQRSELIESYIEAVYADPEGRRLMDALGAGSEEELKEILERTKQEEN